MSDPGGYRSYAGDDLVTGEGVAVEVPSASVASRMASGALDIALAAVLLIGGFLFFSVALVSVSDAVLGVVAIVYSTLVLVGVPATLETMTRGRTLGKLALGLRAVRDDGGPITGRHALVRALVGYVEIYLLLGIPALLSAMIHPRGKRLGDMAAGTVVLSARARLQLLPPPGMPPALHPWVASADVAALPSGLTVAVRQFLARAPGTRAGVTAPDRARPGARGAPARQPATARRRPPRGRPRGCRGRAATARPRPALARGAAPGPGAPGGPPAPPPLTLGR